MIDYVQFRSNYLTSNIATISLEKPAVPFAEKPKTDDTSHLLQKMWPVVKLAQSDTDDLDFVPGARYVFKKPVIDFYGNIFNSGDQLTYTKRYPPYHGLHILLFSEVTLYLHEHEHAEILGDMARFLGFASDS